MKLADAHALLVDDGIADNHRYFAEVYKHYNFTDERTLKDYLDFIEHEPYLWMKGFPTRLTTKLAMSKPKTAVIKLLKKSQVVQALGAEYVEHIHSVIWNTFKKEIDKVVAERNKTTATNAVIETNATNATSESLYLEVEEESVGTVETYETLPAPPIRFPSHSTHTHPLESDEDRVEFLKTLLLKMVNDLPQNGAADAFRLLVSRV